MRIRLLIPLAAAALALSACGERPTPKPPLPTKVTAPITPAAPEAAPTPAAAPAAVCPPQPAPVCPPAVVKTVKAKPVVHRKVHRKTTRKHKTYARVGAPPEPGLYPYKRYHGETMERDYADRGDMHRKHGHRHHRHDGGYEDGYREGYASGQVDHYHAYGNSGAVEHYAIPDEDRYAGRVEDRYSAGGRSYERYERHDSYSSSQAGARGYVERRDGDQDGYRDGCCRDDGYRGGYRAEQGRGYSAQGGSSYSYSERSRETGRASSSYSESYSESGGYRRVESSQDGCCRPASTEAAGRDRNGFLTWPGKVPAAY